MHDAAKLCHGILFARSSIFVCVTSLPALLRRAAASRRIGRSSHTFQSVEDQDATQCAMYVVVRRLLLPVRHAFRR